MASQKTDGQRINALAVYKFLRIESDLPVGSLEARRLANFVQFNWRYTYDGATKREPLGLYDPAAPPRSLSPSKSRGLSIAAAKHEARNSPP